MQRRYERLTVWDWGAIATLIAIASVAAVTAADYGVSNDEYVQQLYGEKLLKFYTSRFADWSAFQFKDLFYYGGLFDLTATLLAAHLPFELYETRHLLCASIGIIGLGGVFMLGRFLAGPRAGCLALLLLALTGPWYGGMFNHTKDIPFAVGMIWGVYFLCRIAAALPRPKLADTLLFGVSLGLSLGLRVGAVLLLAYLALSVAAWLAMTMRAEGWRGRAMDIARIAAVMAPALVVAYGLMAVFWPWAVLDPLNPIRALAHFSSLDMGIQTILDGEVVAVSKVPPQYLPIYLMIKLPIVLLVGLAAAGISFLMRLRGRRQDGPIAGRTRAIGVTATAALLPVVYFILVRPTAYDGIRHFLFVVPPLAVLAGAGLDRLLARATLRGPVLATAAASAIALLVAVQASSLVLLHPNQYVDYNLFVGGPDGAEELYVMDYWGNSVPEATDWLAEFIQKQYPGRPVPRTFKVFAVCAERLTFEEAAPSFLVWTGDRERADFLIAPMHMHCADYVDRPPRGTLIHEVKRLGAVLSVVKDWRRHRGHSS
ncbi:MAG: hypothetical protein WAS73_17550 [Defluviicoccus sp.]